jgi:hypothetical protein
VDGVGSAMRLALGLAREVKDIDVRRSRRWTTSPLSAPGPGFRLDLVGIGIGADQHLAMEGGVGAKDEAWARHGEDGRVEQNENDRNRCLGLAFGLADDIKNVRPEGWRQVLLICVLMVLL